MEAETPGLLVQLEQTWFLPADVAKRVVRRATISPVPGSRVGITIVEGRVVTVLRVGGSASSGPLGDLVLCEIGGETVGLAGFEVLAAGRYPRTGDGVIAQGRPVRRFDVETVVTRQRASSLPPPKDLA